MCISQIRTPSTRITDIVTHPCTFQVRKTRGRPRNHRLELFFIPIECFFSLRCIWGASALVPKMTQHSTIHYSRRRFSSLRRFPKLCSSLQSFMLQWMMDSVTDSIVLQRSMDSVPFSSQGTSEDTSGTKSGSNQKRKNSIQTYDGMEPNVVHDSRVQAREERKRGVIKRRNEG